MASTPELLKVEKTSEITEENIDVREKKLEFSKEDEANKARMTLEKQQTATSLLQKVERSETHTQPQITVAKDSVLIDIEEILAKDLAEIYHSLPDKQRPLFKNKGEQVAEAVRIMIDSGKVKARKILHLIREWLKLVPGVKKFFLEQEAKIKTDDILKYAQEQQKIKSNQNQI